MNAIWIVNENDTTHSWENQIKKFHCKIPTDLWQKIFLLNTLVHFLSGKIILLQNKKIIKKNVQCATNTRWDRRAFEAGPSMPLMCEMIIEIEKITILNPVLQIIVYQTVALMDPLKLTSSPLMPQNICFQAFLLLPSG